MVHREESLPFAFQVKLKSIIKPILIKGSRIRVSRFEATE